MTSDPSEENEVVETKDSGYDANNAKHVSERKAASGRKDKRLKETYKLLMSHVNGRELIWDLLTMCGIHQTSFDINPQVMAFKEGGRNIGLQIEARLAKADSRMFEKMREENSNG